MRANLLLDYDGVRSINSSPVDRHKHASFECDTGAPCRTDNELLNRQVQQHAKDLFIGRS
jgi:hypothetical protein